MRGTPGHRGGKPVIRVTDAARYLLAIQEPDDLMTPLKIQKLLYYAQGYALALHGRRLFSDKIKAWANGPVVPKVRAMFKPSEDGAIPAPTDFDPLSIDAKARVVIERVYLDYGRYSGARLVEMTHAEIPWSETAQNDEIPVDLIASFFSERLGAARP